MRESRSKTFARMLLAFGTVTLMALLSAAAHADEFCTVLEKIVAARKDSFQSISSKDGSTKVKLPGALSCEVDEDDFFDCDFVSQGDERTAQTAHQMLDAKVSACYPNAKRTVEAGQNGKSSIDFELSEDGPKISVNKGRAIDTYYVHVWVDNDELF